MQIPTVTLPSLNRLFGGKEGDEPTAFADLTPEEQAEVLAEEKAERIKFHRKSVRSGPVRWRTVTTGQQRRQAARDQAALERKANRNHRRNFKAKQQAVAILRGQLQAVGALPYRTEGFTPSPGGKVAAFQWIIHKFGPRDEQGRLILDEGAATKALEAATAEYARLTRPAAKA